MSKQSNIIIGITGSIAAYKAYDVMRSLKKDGLGVKCIVTQSGMHFVSKLTIETLLNDTMYTETCASVGLVMFAHRMLLIEEDRCYADVMEQALYNNLLSGMSQDGTRYSMSIRWKCGRKPAKKARSRNT